MYSGTLVTDLIRTVERVTDRKIVVKGDEFDQLCEAKIAIANKIHKDGPSKELRDLWHKADKLQEGFWKHEKSSGD